MNKLIVLGYGWALGNSLVVLITFVSAYFNENKIIININRFGEAHLELVVLIVMNIVSAIGFIIIYLGTFKKPKCRQMLKEGCNHIGLCEEEEKNLSNLLLLEL